MATPDLDPIVRARRPSADARPYDFARPRSISDRQLRTTEAVHVGFAARIAEILGEAIGDEVMVRCTAVAEVLAVDVELSRARPAVLFVATLGPGGPPVAIDVAPALALFLVERQLGGTDPLGAEARALSGLERAVIERDWLPLLGVAFAETWETVPPTPQRFTADPDALALAPPEASVVVADFEISVGGGTAVLSFAYPAATLRLLLDATTPAPAAAMPEAGVERVGNVHLDLRAEVGGARLSVGSILRLAPGDVIPLNRAPDAPVPVWIDNHLRFEARAGTRGRHLALQVLTPPEPPSDR